MYAQMDSSSYVWSTNLVTKVVKWLSCQKGWIELTILSGIYNNFNKGQLYVSGDMGIREDDIAKINRNKLRKLWYDKSLTENANS